MGASQRGGKNKRGCWRKQVKGKQRYFFYPDTKQGYQQALLALVQLRAKLDTERPNANIFQHHKNVFQNVTSYYEQFGVPEMEGKLFQQVESFLEWIESRILLPELPDPIELVRECATHPQLFADLKYQIPQMGRESFQLSDKWQDRIRQLEERGRPNKKPQTIGYWVDEYEASQVRRANLRVKSKANKAFKIGPFKRWVDLNRHVTSINEEDVKRFHGHLYDHYSSVDSQKTYYGNFKSFLKWLRRQRACDFIELPINFDDPELRFTRTEGLGKKRLKQRKQLWTPSEFENVLDNVPQPYKTYCVLMLNCGFRQSDLNALRHDEIDLTEGRIIYQRNKTLNVETSPVVNYKLWPVTMELIQEVISDDPEFVFSSRTGKRLIVEEVKNGKPTSYDTVSRYWRRARTRFGLEDKRLDFIRKTGSTVIEKANRDMDTLYLAESLKGVAKINYSFNDGEVLEEFDDAVLHLGAKFGFCDPPSKTVTLTPEMVQKLEAAGIEV